MGKAPLKPKWTNCVFCNNLINCSRKHDLEAHINIHTKERPYDCDLCDQAFNSSSSRSNHYNIVHLGVKFKCDRCEKIFNRVNTFRGHRKKVHGVEPEKGQKKIKIPGSCMIIPDKPPVPGPAPVPVQASKKESQEKSGVSKKRRAAAKKDKDFYKEIEEGEGEEEQEEGLLPTSPLPHLRTTPPQFDMTTMLVGLKKQYDLIQERNGKRWDPGFFLHMNRYTPDKPVETRAEEQRPEVNKITKRSNDSVQIGQTEIKRGRPPKNTENTSLDDLAEVQSSAKKQRLDGTQLKCPHCPKVFSQKSHLVKHIGQYHCLVRNIGAPGVKHNSNLLEDDDLSCPFCGEKSEDKDSLEKHLQDNHNDKLQSTPKYC